MAYRQHGAITVGRWLIFLVFVALTCAPIGHMAWFWFVEQERGRQSESWPTADGVFERNGVRGASDSSRHAAYRYTFDGKTYQGFREGFAYKQGPPGTVGAAIKVYVNPADPSMSVLYPGESDARWPFGVGVGLTVFLALFAFSRWPGVSRRASAGPARQTSWLPFLASSLVMLGACWMLAFWVMELRHGRASEVWPAVPGVLVQSGGKKTGTVYRYEVGGRAYRGERVRFAWGRKHGYSSGEEIRVFVNPADPTDSVLHPGPNWSPWIPLFVAAWIAISSVLVWASWPPWGSDRPRAST